MMRHFYLNIVMLLAVCVLSTACAYNSRTRTFDWALGERPVKPPAYPIPDLSPSNRGTSQGEIPPPAEW